MKKLLVFGLIGMALLVSSHTKVKAEEGVAGISITLDKADRDVIQTAYNSSVITDSEKKILYRIVEAEAGGTYASCRKNVCSVVLNRLKNKSFGDTIKEVVFDTNAFSSIDNGRYEDVEITETTIKAVDEVLKEGVTTDATYFVNLDYVSSKMKRWFEDNLTYLFTDKANHSFYKE